MGRMAEESLDYVEELAAEVLSLDGTPASDTSTAGKIYRTWMDVKAPFTGKDAHATLASCEFGEDAIQRAYNNAMDDDLLSMTREQLIDEVKRLRSGVRAHRDASGHGLCWHHPALWRLLPEKTDSLPTVPSWPEFLRGCVQYRQSLDRDLPDAPRSDEPYRPPAG